MRYRFGALCLMTAILPVVAWANQKFRVVLHARTPSGIGSCTETDLPNCTSSQPRTVIAPEQTSVFTSQSTTTMSSAPSVLPSPGRRIGAWIRTVRRRSSSTAKRKCPGTHGPGRPGPGDLPNGIRLCFRAGTMFRRPDRRSCRCRRLPRSSQPGRRPATRRSD